MKIEKFVKIIVIIFLIGWLNQNVKAQCDCKIAEEKEVGYGANEIIEMKEKVRKTLFGTVKYYAYNMAIEKAIVEVFRANDFNEDAYTVANTSKREMACITR
ncbi:MAG: hypothetical protein JNM06_25275, partial [Blastocatellia bacterium]|nr:hypothetical protein [Blastocatellia bacterium]